MRKGAPVDEFNRQPAQTLAEPVICFAESNITTIRKLLTVEVKKYGSSHFVLTSSFYGKRGMLGVLTGRIINRVYDD